MIPLLAPLFRGPLEPHGEALQCGPGDLPADAVHVADLVAAPGTFLLPALRRHAQRLGADPGDARPAASMWALRYLAALLPPVVAAASALEHVFPVAVADTWVRLDGHGAPFRFHIRRLGAPAPGASTSARYAPLLLHHLEPLFDAIAGIGGVPPKILWGSAARHLEPILDQVLALTGGAATARRDRHLLLDDPCWWPHGTGDARAGRNRLHAPRREVARGGVAVRLHRQCCLSYLLPREVYCGACPLAPANRLA